MAVTIYGIGWIGINTVNSSYRYWRLLFQTVASWAPVLLSYLLSSPSIISIGSAADLLQPQPPNMHTHTHTHTEFLWSANIQV